MQTACLALPLFVLLACAQELQVNFNNRGCDGEDAQTCNDILAACPTTCSPNQYISGFGESSCGGQVVNLGTSTEHCGVCDNTCGEEEICRNGACVCPTGGTEFCDGIGCVNKREDDQNCGSCGNVCQGEQPLCLNGICTCGDVDVISDAQNCGGCGAACEGAEVCELAQCVCNVDNCSGVCTDLQTDADNCGLCGEQCGDGKECVKGYCVCEGAAEGMRECQFFGTDAILRCTDTNTDSDNCGVCGNFCSTGLCEDGVCGCETEGETYCGSSAGCVDLLTDEGRCGSCKPESFCEENYDCVDGACECPFTLCDRSCVDIDSDITNCGGCGIACEAGFDCIDGACIVQCPEGFEICSNQCRDTNSDINHCGGCEQPCTVNGAACFDGVCECVDMITDICDGACVNTDTSSNHCGECNNPCTGDDVCSGGECGAVCAFTLCNGHCTDTDFDNENCGECGNICSQTLSGSACEFGTCFCQGNLDDCGGGVCISTSSDEHCGGCDVSCGEDQQCSTDTCICSQPQLTACGQDCLDTTTDMDNCGSCGNSCNPSSQICFESSCISSSQEYDIEIEFTSSVTPQQEAAFLTAKERWEALIIGDVEDFGPIDDIRISASIVEIDGPGGTLGQAGPTQLRGNALPVRGVMEFDEDDVANLQSQGNFEEVILHEMGHVLGLGTLWQQLSLVTSSECASDAVWVGTNGNREYRKVYPDEGSNARIKIEEDGGEGTCGGHWDEEDLRNELMTGFLNVNLPVSPLSRISVGSLHDLGYVVNYNEADEWAPSALGEIFPTAFGLKAAADKVGGSDLQYDKVMKRPPMYIVDEETGKLVSVSKLIQKRVARHGWKVENKKEKPNVQK